jgi:hypothetical protein
MTQCWSEGTLRAYLDRELPSEEMQRVAAHLGECTVCDCLCTELAGRAAHVSALMELLPEWIAATPRPVLAARKRPNWIGIAVAVAACLALAAYLLPNRRPPEIAVAAPPGIVPPPTVAFAPPPVVTAAADTDPAPVERPATRRPRRVRPPAPETAYFVALDDEPFESGVIMRMDVKPGKVQADIVFGPDGRAHAFRLVNASQRNF